MFETFDVVLFYDRGKGILVKKGRDVFTKFLSMYDSFNGTSYASTPGLIPRDSHTSLELIGRFIMAGAQNVLVNQEEKKNLKMAIVIDYAQYVIPDASNLALSGELSENLIKIIDWAGDPAILGSVITTCLVTENLMDLNKAVSTNPYNAKIEIKLPNEKEAL
jgi:hypothetical protein